MAVLTIVLILSLVTAALVIQAITWRVIDMDVMVRNVELKQFRLWDWLLLKEQWVT